MASLSGAQQLLQEYLAAQRDEIPSEIGVVDIVTAVRPLLSPESDLMRAVDAVLAAPERVEVDVYPDYSGMVVTAGDSEDPRDDSDESLFSSPVPLEQHTEHVRVITAKFLRHLGLHKEFGSDLDLAAEGHDPGKSERRFQAMLYGGRERQPDEPVLAKSGARSAGARRRAATLAGWPTGERHEFISAAMLAHSEVARSRAVDLDLVLHLVGSHHGFGRPFAPIVRDAYPTVVRATLADESVVASSDHRLYGLESGWVDQFWRLNDRYGNWGLAFLEAILRRADCVATRKEEEVFFRG
jgi:CRISPR-associated endonuclease/helicase Cas3